jgi:hypothetical protein
LSSQGFLESIEKMLSTKSFKETVHLRVERDPAFRLALFQEALSALFIGDIPLGKTILRDLLIHN